MQSSNATVDRVLTRSLTGILKVKIDAALRNGVPRQALLDLVRCQCGGGRTPTVAAVEAYLFGGR